MRRAVREKLADGMVDVIFAFSSSMAPYVAMESTRVKILDFVDSDATKWAQYAAAKTVPIKWLYDYEAARLKTFESAMLDRFDACVFVSNRETPHLSTHRATDRIAFVQNGIDLTYYQPVSRRSRSQSIIFTGAMDYFPNIDAVTYFVHEILFRVRMKFPEAEFLIVGSRPSPAVLRLASVPGVKVVGGVADVRPFIARAHVAVVPLRISQGIQNKLLEALASGLRVVATPNAAAGLTSVTDLPLIVASDAETFADRVCDCLQLPPLGGADIEKCRKALRMSYDWTTNLAVLEDLCAPLKRNISLPHAWWLAQESDDYRFHD
jgi:sugar transferase (PEP-CTERM/EpsH1 system associated)